MTMTTIKQLAARSRRSTAIGLIVLFVSSPAFPQQNPTGYTFRSQSELVLVNVTARDSHGNLVRDLEARGFPRSSKTTRPQQVSSFDVENTGHRPPTELSQTARYSAPLVQLLQTAEHDNDSKHRAIQRPPANRSIFDLSSVQPDEIDRCCDCC
jgi:hypothetical protein